jgi:hypothetical protein
MDWRSDVYCPECDDAAADDARTEIERLRARVAELEEILAAVHQAGGLVAVAVPDDILDTTEPPGEEGEDD